MHWELWGHDFFDRDAAPSLEGSGEDFVAGCAGLWRKTVDEGVQEDGRPTFLGVSLSWAGGRLSLPRDPFRNPELARLKGWVTTKGVIWALASTLSLTPDESTARRCLAEVGAASDPWDLCARLGYPTPRPPPRARFDLASADEALRFLSSPEADAARFVVLLGPGLGSGVWEAFAACPRLGQVEYLSLSGMTLGADGLARLAAARLPRLARLTLQACALDDAALAVLARAPWAVGLRELHLDNGAREPLTTANTFGDPGARVLAEAGSLCSLEALDVGWTSVGDAGLLALWTSPTLRALRSLTAWKTRQTASGARELLATPRVPGTAPCVVHGDFTARTIDFSRG